ncbi:MAG: hypothetical protein IKG14_05770 [Clostridia bacterium]|nr:hypothetical protein [Clostridia bacterium]
MNQSDIVNIIIQTINTIFGNLFSSIDNNIYLNLDNLVFVDSSLISKSMFEKLLGGNGKNGLLYLVDSMIFGLALFYVIRYYYFNIIDTTVERPGQFFFKLLIFTLLVNSSYFLLEQFLNILSFLSLSIQEIGKDIIGHNIDFSELITTLNKVIVSDSTESNIFSLDGLIKSFVSVGLVSLLFSYSLRYVLLQVLLLFSPFSILSLISTSTSWIFKSWFKSLISLFLIQIFIPLILIVIFSVDNNEKILYVGGIYALMKINDFIKEMFGGISFTVFSNVSSMLSGFKKGV